MTRIQKRRGTAAEWTATNPVLGEGEEGYETDTGRSKIGDGENQWSDLGYKADFYRTPYDHGAAGDGTTDDTVAVQAAYAWLKDHGGGTLLLPRGNFHIPGNLTMDTPGVSLVGRGGVLGGGQVDIGAASGGATGMPWGGTFIEGVLLDGGDQYGATSKGVTLKNCRGLRINRCWIYDVGKAISADVDDGAEGFHTLAWIRLDHVFGSGNRYFVFTDTAGASMAVGQDWQVLADWEITGCASNLASITNFHLGGIDGVRFAGNVGQLRNYGTSDVADGKAHNIFIGQGDQIHLHNSDLFEAGLSAVSLGADGILGNFVLSGLNIVWPGQYQMSDGIELHSSTAMNGVVTGCTFDSWTHAAIGLYSGDVRSVEIGDNAFRWEFAPESWLGTGSLTASNNYRVYVDSGCTGLPSRRDFMPQAATNGLGDYLAGSTFGTAADQKGVFSGVCSARRSTSITATTNLWTINDFLQQATGSGLVLIQARGGADDAARQGNSAKIATYLLLVSQDGVIEIASNGYTSGTAATDPSFTWGVSGANLQATPIGSTSGTFWIEATALGAMVLR